MERIGVVTLLRRESGQTSSGSFVTRELAEPSQEEIANERGVIHVCILRPKRTHWEQIDWSQCERQVRRLQARIVKATREGRWGKVKALQWLLTHSFSGQSLGRETSDGKSRQEDRPEWTGRYGALRRPNPRPSNRCNVGDISRNRCGVSISRKPTGS